MAGRKVKRKISKRLGELYKEYGVGIELQFKSCCHHGILSKNARHPTTLRVSNRGDIFSLLNGHILQSWLSI